MKDGLHSIYGKQHENFNQDKGRLRRRRKLCQALPTCASCRAQVRRGRAM